MIPLFLTNFREFIKNGRYNPEGNEHPVFWFEDKRDIYFYKPIGSVIYLLQIEKEAPLPKNITIDNLKQEFNAIEIPSMMKQ